MDLEHPQITQTLRTGYPTNEDLARDNEPIENNYYDDYTTDEGGDQMESVKEFTVNDILDSGARVRVQFFDCEDLQAAYTKLKPYKHLGKVERHETANAMWLYIRSKNIDVTVFL